MHGTKAALWPGKAAEEFTGGYDCGGGQKARVFDFMDGAFEPVAPASRLLPFGSHFGAAAVLRACVPSSDRINFDLWLGGSPLGGWRPASTRRQLHRAAGGGQWLLGRDFRRRASHGPREPCPRILGRRPEEYHGARCLDVGRGRTRNGPRRV